MLAEPERVPREALIASGEQPFSNRTAFSAIDWALGRLDAWLETMRDSCGYGGPVVHWWQQSLMYTGVGFDWRYEGIIAGYCLLWERTGDQRWLIKARRAGDDLVAGQHTDGHYTASAFEINPATAGTPHEAACDVGLLILAHTLRTIGDASWQRYAGCAERNLRAFYIEQLWDAETRSFRDGPTTATFVPNKAATACEALFLLAEITADARWAEQYALPTLDRIVAHQVRRQGRLEGAIAQNSFGARIVDKYFPIYIARCVPALLRGARWTDNHRYAECALRAMQFIARWADADGGFPTVIYSNQRVSRGPRWIAPLGDVLRAADALGPYGFATDLRATLGRLLAGQDATGGIQTASDFGAQVWGRLKGQPDLRDMLHVVGWCDKAFRYLATHAGPAIPAAASSSFEAACVFRGQALHLAETPALVEVVGRRGCCYRWRKGDTWPEVAARAFWLR
jgi:hypothetical protein